MSACSVDVSVTGHRATATLLSILSLAVAGAIWSLAAAMGFAPWLQLDVGLGGVSIDAGLAVQLPSRCSFSASASSSP